MSKIIIDLDTKTIALDESLPGLTDNTVVTPIQENLTPEVAADKVERAMKAKSVAEIREIIKPDKDGRLRKRNRSAS